MRKGLIIAGSISGAILAILYIGFLFILPNVIDLNGYKPIVQKLIKEQIPLNVDFNNAKISVTPLLSVGVRAEDLSVKFDDGKTLFSADKAIVRVALPSLLAMTVKVSTAEVENPYLDFTIVDGKQFKILTLVEEMLQSQKDNQKAKEPQETPWFVKYIRIKVPNVKLKNYKVLVNDEKSNHNLQLSGELLDLGYFNGKTGKVKTIAELTSDGERNIIADININTFLPPIEPSLDEEDDRPEKIELPFINPVLMYQKYNLKSNLQTKLKIREKDGLYKLYGFVNVDNTTLNLSDYQLPECYFHGKFRGTKSIVDTDISVTKDEKLKLNGMFDYGKHKKLDMEVTSDKIHFQNIIIVTKAFLNSIQVRNSLDTLTGKGYIEANAKIKTNFKKLESNGSIIIKDGTVINKFSGLGFTKTNLNFLFDNNILEIKDSSTLINKAPLKFDGKIDEKSNIDIAILADNVPVRGLYHAFAPQDLKDTLDIYSGNLSVDTTVKGELKQAVGELKLRLTNLVVNSDTFKISNNNAEVNMLVDKTTSQVDILNRGLNITLPQSNSTIFDNHLNIKILGSKMTIDPTELLINKGSIITVKGVIDSNKKEPIFDISANGSLDADDLKQFAGAAAAGYIDAQGSLPTTMTLKGNMKRQDMVLRVLTSPSNYVTPINFKEMKGKNGLFQAKIDFKGNRLKIKQTGLFNRTTKTDDKGNTTEHLEEILGVSGTITGLKSQPFINVIKIAIPKTLNGSFHIFRNSGFTLPSNYIYIFGDVQSPLIRGQFGIKNLYIKDLLTSLDELYLYFSGKNLTVTNTNLNLNGSDVSTALNLHLTPEDITTISNLKVTSNHIDLDRLMMVSKTATRVLPKSTAKPNNYGTTQQQAEIPVTLKNSSIALKNIKTGNIVLKNTNSKIALHKNIFYLNNLHTHAFDGIVQGNISMNMLNSLLKIDLNGRNINTEKMLLATANMKDTLSGKLSFTTNLSINGGATNYEKQMKSLRGNVKFTINNGQFGPFGKVENLILAENIRESQIFQTALGGIVNGLTTIDTTHYKELKGSLSFQNGITTINPIISDGNVLTLYIAGNFDLIKNNADMKVRGRLASMLSNMLGPISNVNPVNLVKVTPGLNVASAKLFTLFTQPVTQDELNKIPAFGSKTDNLNATNFQVVIRGDVAKPLKLVKSFKWLALQDQINSASAFVSTLPEPESITTTVEEAQAQEEYEARETTKIKNKIFKKEAKEKETQKAQTELEMQQIQAQEDKIDEPSHTEKTQEE